MRFRGFGYTTCGVRPALVGSLLALVAGCGSGGTEQRDFLAPPPASSQVAASIVVSPKQPTVFEADSVQLSAVVRNQAQSPVTAAVDWRVSGPSGAAISSSGVFRPAGAGSYRVVAWVRNNPALADSTDITVVSAVLEALILSPRTVDLDAGGTATFNVQAEWNVNAPGLPQPIVDFSATGGTIDEKGHFVAGPVAGTFQVRVRDRKSAKGDSAHVKVRAPSSVSIAVSPSQITMSPGAVRIFQATATLSDGTTAPAEATWTAVGNGTITPQGFFTAGAAGSGATAQVTATVAGTSLSGTAAVTISQPTATLTGVEVQPGSATLPAGGSQVFTAQGRYSDGSTTTLPVTWTATGGTITSVGAYAAGSQAGAFRVVAVAANGSGLADTVPVAVTAATVTGLQVSPGGSSVAPGGTQQFAVSATWSDGVSRPAPAVAWTATGGAVTPSGLYTAGSTPGTWAVTASASGVSAQVLVTVSSPPPPASATITSLVVSPGSAVVIAGQSAQFTARAAWSDGAVTTPQVVWSATGGAITSSGLYAANLEGGSRRVIARLSGGTLADTAEVTVVAVTQFVLNPGSVTLETGKTQQFTTSVLWSDGSTSRPVVVAYSASGGTMVSSGLYTAGQVAGLFSVIASCNGCGKADTAVVTLTSPSASQPTLTSLSIAPVSVSLAANATQQFTVSATWSDGSSTAPSLSWSVLGIGSVNQSGLYTASSNAGSASVIARHLSSGKADTAFVTITSSAPPPPPPSTVGAFHEPAGFSPIVGRQFNSLGTGANGRGTGSLPYKTGGSEGWDDAESRFPNIQLGADPLALLSASSIVRMKYPAQTVASNQTFSPGVIQTLGFTGSAYGPRNYKRLYVRFAFRVSSNWQGHPTQTNKILFIRSVDGPNRFEPIIRLRGSGSNPLELNVDLQGSPQDPRTDTGGLRPNTSSAAAAFDVQRGVWHVVEAVLVVGPAGAHSGMFQMWLDGSLSHDYRDVEYSKNGVANVWDALHFAPTWGGQGGTITADMWMDLDEAYVSGAP